MSTEHQTTAAATAVATQSVFLYANCCFNGLTVAYEADMKFRCFNTFLSPLDAPKRLQFLPMCLMWHPQRTEELSEH